MKSSCQVWRVSLAAILGGVELVAQVNPAVQGSWEPPFQHVHASNVGAITGTDARVPFQPNPPAWPTASPSDGPQFNAVHMALIPRGPYQGMVLIWDRQNISPNNPAQSYQRYTIFDPTPGANPTFRNFFVQVPTNVAGMFGDFFCAGHAWSPFGHLVIAGGTNYLDNGGTPIAGGNLLYLFDPETPNLLYGGAGNGSFGAWRRQPDMLVPRWYPTVTLTHRFASDPQGREVLIVSGGSSYTSTYVPSPLDDGHCTCEAFFSNPATPTLPPSLSRDIRSNHANAVLPAGHNLVPGVFVGLRDPNTLAFNWLFEYPRLHLLTNGRLVFTGVGGSGGVVDHDLFPGVWDVTVAAAPSMPPFFVGRYENSSVLLPYYPGVTDRVLRVGGHVNAVGGPQSLDAVEHCHALSTLNNDWVVTNTPIAYARHHANLLILPDLTLLSLNGEKSQGTGAPPIPQTIPELFKNGAWTDMAPEGSTRDYHATALVLPDGRVLSAGGEDREYDFQIYSPPYLAGGGFQMEFDLPTLVPSGTASALGYNQIFTIEVGDLPIGVVPEEAVLLAPGSITHHSDMHQRALKLAIVQRNGPQIEVKSPADTKTAPRGFYMLFALSNHGVPSKARWVWLQ